MTDESRIVQCPHCEKWLSYQLVKVKCPYCDKTMVFSLPEYEFYEGPIGCEHCQRKSHLKIGGYYTGYGSTTIATTEPHWKHSRNGGYSFTTGGRLLSVQPVIPPELALRISDKIPHEVRRNLESAIRCLEIGEYQAVAMLCRRCVQTALKVKGIRDAAPIRMIHAAHQQGVLSELANKQADAVTFMGGKAAHPTDDTLLDVKESDVRQGLQMVRRVLLELFDPQRLAVF